MSEQPIDATVLRLKTPAECEQYILNVQEKWPELARQARRRAVELRAAKHNAQTEAEKDALRAIYAYEEILSAKHGHRQSASRTWPMIPKYGLLGTVERIVKRKDAAPGYTTLADMGMQDFSFEAVILRHADQFSKEAVAKARERVTANPSLPPNVS